MVRTIREGKIIEKFRFDISKYSLKKKTSLKTSNKTSDKDRRRAKLNDRRPSFQVCLETSHDVIRPITELRARTTTTLQKREVLTGPGFC